jgi:glycosyltransferase involved in cell wall biosynthesis
MTHPPKPFRVPSVVTVHDLIPYRLEQYHARARERAYFREVRKNLRMATHLIAISEATFADIQSIMPGLAGQVTVIPNGIHPAYFISPDTEHLEDLTRRFSLRRHPRILYVGGYDLRKNVGTLIQAASRVFKETDGELVLVGAQGLQGIKELVAGAGIGDQVIATPWLSRDDLATLYQTADVFAYPSIYEGFGMPPAQALAAGIPVVAGDSAAVREVVEDAAILVEPTAVELWADSLLQVIENPALAQKMVARGRELAQDLSWDQVAAKYQAVYERLVSG